MLEYFLIFSLITTLLLSKNRYKKIEISELFVDKIYDHGLFLVDIETYKFCDTWNKILNYVETNDKINIFSEDFEIYKYKSCTKVIINAGDMGIRPKEFYNIITSKLPNNTTYFKICYNSKNTNFLPEPFLNDFLKYIEFNFPPGIKKIKLTTKNCRNDLSNECRKNLIMILQKIKIPFDCKIFYGKDELTNF